MQYKKTSFTLSSRSGGFTLIEMLTVIAIMGIIGAVVLFNHGKFTNETILTNMAYEFALSVREAQIYGVSVRAEGADFNESYGIYVPSGVSSKQYILFADLNSDFRYNTSLACGEPGTECVTTYTMQRNIEIAGVKTKSSSNGTCSDQSGFSVLFNRPNPEPIFSNSSRTINQVLGAQIEIRSKDNVSRYVIIYTNGQITVESSPQLCP